MTREEIEGKRQREKLWKPPSADAQRWPKKVLFWPSLAVFFSVFFRFFLAPLVNKDYNTPYMPNLNFA